MSTSLTSVTTPWTAFCNQYRRGPRKLVSLSSSTIILFFICSSWMSKINLFVHSISCHTMMVAIIFYTSIAIIWHSTLTKKNVLKSILGLRTKHWLYRSLYTVPSNNAHARWPPNRNICFTRRVCRFRFIQTCMTLEFSVRNKIGFLNKNNN